MCPLIFKKLFLTFSFSINSHELHHSHREFSADLMSIEKGDSYLWFFSKREHSNSNPICLIIFLLPFITIYFVSICFVINIISFVSFYCEISGYKLINLCLDITEIEHFPLEHSIRKLDFLENKPQNF